MPNRIVREGINSSARVNALSLGAEVFYRRLISVVDDYGRYHGSVVTLRGACWPTNPEKIREKDVSKWLTELLKGDDPLVKTYAVGGATYVEIQEFRQITRSKSRFPDPPWMQSARNLQADCAQSESNLQSGCAQNDCTSRMRMRSAKANTGAPPADEPKADSEFELELDLIASEIQDRHPPHRRCSVSMVKSKLRVIAKHAPPADRVDKLRAINQNHIAWAAHWAKDGGTYAKALENWLAPTMGRFDEEPPPVLGLQPVIEPRRLML
jgi:hypothetical protein